MNLTSTQILVAEDNKNMRTILTSILGKVGFKKIGEAENGEIAWEKIQAQNYDLVITDLMIPQMDGLELLEKIRTGNDQIKNTPVLIVTSSYQEKDITLALKWKVNGYITKPFDVKTILSKMKEILR